MYAGNINSVHHLGTHLGTIGGYMLGSKPKSDGAHLMPDGSTMSDSMTGMTAGLQGKTGDDFDKAFLEEMIVHHEGAVEMAEMALRSGNHPELKQLAEGIIQAQTIEIGMMRDWQQSWFK